MPVLDGLRVVITRAAHQAGELAVLLRKQGAEPLLLPVIAIGPPLDAEPLRHAAAHANDYDWIVFTSANAVAALAAQLPHSAENCTARVASIGQATREAAENRGFRVDVVPESYVSESLIAALGPARVAGRQILIPGAAVSRDLVPAGLRQAGAQVDVIEAYRNMIPPEAGAQAATVFQKPYPEWVTFASPSAVDNLVDLTGPEKISQASIATIGPITSGAVRKHGLKVLAEAKIQTTSALVNAICQSELDQRGGLQE